MNTQLCFPGPWMLFTGCAAQKLYLWFAQGEGCTGEVSEPHAACFQPFYTVNDQVLSLMDGPSFPNCLTSNEVSSPLLLKNNRNHTPLHNYTLRLICSVIRELDVAYWGQPGINQVKQIAVGQILLTFCLHQVPESRNKLTQIPGGGKEREREKACV